MKNKTLLCLICAFSLILSVINTNLGLLVKAEEAPTPTKIELTSLDWEGNPTCGWTLDGTGLVQKGVDVATGKAPVVNGITYGANSIGTHLPFANENQDRKCYKF